MRPTLKACALVSFVASAGALMWGLFGRAAANDDIQAAGAVRGDLLALATGPAAIPSASPSQAPSASPRFVYGPGPSGMGYQRVAPTAARSQPTRQASTGRSGGRVRDWTTGHSLPSGGLMNKPWLKPR